MELHHLRCFSAVARHLNFSRAAEEMHVTQPTISRTINELEQSLGFRLFDRNRQRVIVTDEGRALISRSEKILAEVDMALYELKAVAAGKGGELVIGHDWRLSFGFIQDSLAEFRNQNPQAEVTMPDLLSHELLGALRARKIHLAFVPSEFVSMDDRMERLQVQSCGFVVVMSAKNRMARKRKVKLRELSQETWMAPTSPGSGYKTFLSRSCHEAGFTPIPGKTAKTVEGMLTLIAAGYGVSLLPRAALPRLSASLRAVPADCGKMTLYAVWLKDTHSKPLDLHIAILKKKTLE
jgi:DNA-binding transcriptional LysR family regulator